jgi:hypothetical protein
MQASRILLALGIAGAALQLSGRGWSASEAAAALGSVTDAIVRGATDPAPTGGITQQEYDALRARAAAFR